MAVMMYGMTVYEEQHLNDLMGTLDDSIKDEICNVFNEWHKREMDIKRFNEKSNVKEEIIRAILDV